MSLGWIHFKRPSCRRVKGTLRLYEEPPGLSWMVIGVFRFTPLAKHYPFQGARDHMNMKILFEAHCREIPERISCRILMFAYHVLYTIYQIPYTIHQKTNTMSCVYLYLYIYIYTYILINLSATPPMRLHFPIFTGRYLQTTDFLGQEEKRQTLSNFRDLTFPTSSFPNLLDVTFQLPGFPTFQLSNFPTFDLSNIPTFQLSNFPTFQLSNFPTFQHSNFPTFQHSNFPTFQHSNIPTFQLSNIETFQHSSFPTFLGLTFQLSNIPKLGPKKLESWED